MKNNNFTITPPQYNLLIFNKLQAIIVNTAFLTPLIFFNLIS